MKPGSVAFLMPCGGPVDPRVLQSSINVVNGARKAGIEVEQIGITDRTLVHTARNWLSKGFLESGCEWAFWMDSDMSLEVRTIPTMLAWAGKLNAKMLTGIYYGRKDKHRPILWRKAIQSEDGRVDCETKDDYCHYPVYPKGYNMPPFQVDVAGFGCVLLHRSVFEAMQYPYFQFEFYTDHAGIKREASEDFYFFVQARNLGFELWAVPELRCGHLGDARFYYQEDMDLGDMELAKLKTDPSQEKEAVR